MSRRKNRKELRIAREICGEAFEPLWRPAPWITRPRPISAEQVAEIQSQARGAALAWLAASLGFDVARDFHQIGDLETLRSAYRVIARATINDVRKWQNEGARSCQQ